MNIQCLAGKGQALVEKARRHKGTQARARRRASECRQYGTLTFKRNELVGVVLEIGEGLEARGETKRTPVANRCHMEEAAPVELGPTGG